MRDETEVDAQDGQQKTGSAFEEIPSSRMQRRGVVRRIPKGALRQAAQQAQIERRVAPSAREIAQFAAAKRADAEASGEVFRNVVDEGRWV
jgi:hypothetical protein